MGLVLRHLEQKEARRLKEENYGRRCEEQEQARSRLRMPQLEQQQLEQYLAEKDPHAKQKRGRSLQHFSPPGAMLTIVVQGIGNTLDVVSGIRDQGYPVTRSIVNNDALECTGLLSSAKKLSKSRSRVCSTMYS